MVSKDLFIHLCVFRSGDVPVGDAKSIAIVLLVIGLLLFISIPEILPCPRCGGWGIEFGGRWGIGQCSTCGGDNQATILQVIIYFISSAFS
jgi:hypothetical protein